MAQLIWQRPAVSWQSSVLLDLLVKVRFAHGKLLAFAPLIESQRGDLLLIDYMDRALTKDHLTELFGDVKNETLNPELKKFLAWWNDPPVGLDGALRAGVALFWFLAISPFAENNDEIAREICELALAQDEKISARLYDLPAQLHLRADDYAKAFAKCLRGDGDITEFLEFYLGVLLRALEQAQAPAAAALAGFQFWKNKNDLELNSRQRQLINFLIANSKTLITNREYVFMHQTSRESAKRDLAQLEKLGLLVRNESQGRSVRYRLITQ